MTSRIHNSHEYMGSYVSVNITSFTWVHNDLDIKTYDTKQESTKGRTRII